MAVNMFISFKLKKGASIPDFLNAAEKLNNEYMSKQSGYISWEQLVDGETWADSITWETMDDAKKILNPSNSSPLASDFYSFINLNSCVVNLFSIEKSYNLK